MRPHRRKPTRLPHPWDSPGKNTGVGCHFLLQRIETRSSFFTPRTPPNAQYIADAQQALNVCLFVTEGHKSAFVSAKLEMCQSFHAIFRDIGKDTNALDLSFTICEMDMYPLTSWNRMQMK